MQIECQRFGLTLDAALACQATAQSAADG